MKFGQEFQKALASTEFPEEWRGSAIDYKHLKKCIKKINTELESIGLDGETLHHLSEWMSPADSIQTVAGQDGKGYYSAATPSLAAVPEEFTPQLRILVDSKTGTPLDATLAPETRESLQKLAKHEMAAAGRREHVGSVKRPLDRLRRRTATEDTARKQSVSLEDARWVQVPLASAKDFFELLEPKLQELETLREAETAKLEEEIFDLGEAVENVVEPVREGFEARREVSYRDLYFWREMFRLYMEKPIFYSEHGPNGGALTFKEAHSRLEDYDMRIRSTGLLEKMRTPEARQAAKRFLDLNVDILKIMHFQEMNARAMTKILKKFDKQTRLEGRAFLRNLRTQYPALLTNGRTGTGGGSTSPGGFASSIARDLNAELATKVLGIVPQVEDWNCPVCYAMAWRPVNLGCCTSVFCINCIIKLQEEGVERCPVCDKETVLQANGRNIDFEAMDFMEKYFPLEAKKRQKFHDRAAKMAERGGGGGKHEEEKEKIPCRTM
ncbi:SPX domain-containing protein [Neohortaea acidophila]|uniref:SPX domain-containing protein n=1 Tax=Neohortaea acidophila TaxID=245834 RepID=A0A6A6PQA0_9PEZI|nr:SPX domain-containing protein [Neohortaea acidophila]KAF2481851.1 SPX domain-containing protein [Neohortaea acidophila]